MTLRLDCSKPGFAGEFDALLRLKRETADDVESVVDAIVEDVARRGDAALLDYTRQFDRVDLTSETMRVRDAEIEGALGACPADALAALDFAKARIEAFHLRQRPVADSFQDALGVRLGLRWTPVESVGLYVPGGTASYPSSVLMNAVPAAVAGVERIVMVAPAPGGHINPLVLAAAHLAGVCEIYRVGGAQAVAALAFGTSTIAPVVKIVGPGNAYVAAAKRRVFGTVGIDSIAGPSEVLVLADRTADPDWIAADLLAQAEHDSAAQSILITDDPALANAVEQAVQRRLETLPRAEVAGASWRDFGAVILVPSLDAAVALVDRLAPEHLEIATDEPERLAGLVRNAGSIFLGHHTPEAVGDYVAGPNHVLPTARTARFSSGLGVLDFMKRTTTLQATAASLRALGPAAITLARAEGLEAHALSVEARLQPEEHGP